MLLYPAIDLTAGRVARGTATDPVDAARRFHAAGAAWLHVVDMDRAFQTGRENDVWVRRLAALPDVRVQLGGGLTDADAVRAALDLGIARVALGASAARDVAALGVLVARCGADRLAVALDVRQGTVTDRVEGGGGERPVDVARRVRDTGIGTVVYRDLDRDGRLGGADLEGARAVGIGDIEVILAGGVSTLDELRAARAAGVAGVIVGRALHEGHFTLAEALACCS